MYGCKTWHAILEFAMEIWAVTRNVAIFFEASYEERHKLRVKIELSYRKLKNLSVLKDIYFSYSDFFFNACKVMRSLPVSLHQCNVALTLISSFFHYFFILHHYHHLHF